MKMFRLHHDRLLSTFIGLFLIGFLVMVSDSDFCFGCDDATGLHCISGFWDCPQKIFREGVKSEGCSRHCCRVDGGRLATADDIRTGATILINPGQPGRGKCQFCPGDEDHRFQCCDQRTLRLPPPLSRCNKYKPSSCVPPGSPRE